jgi:two-component system, NarL family, nitrate/nitrite response regulator NarL
VKNSRTTTNSAAFPTPRKRKPSRIEDREQGAGQESRAVRSLARRRPARPTAEQGPLGSLPKGAVLVGANVLLREGLSRILAAAGYRIVASALCADPQLLSALQRDRSILFIIDPSDDFDAALRQIAQFRERCPAGRVVVLADQPQLSGMVSAFRAGANAYLVKVATCETFVKSLELVMLGMTLLPPEILNFVSERQGGGEHASGGTDDGHAGDDANLGKHAIVEADVEGNELSEGADSSHTPRLSPGERAILRCLTEGDSNKTIARKMVMTEATVKVHVKTILRKIRVRNRTQAAIWAMSNDPLDPAKKEATPASDGLRAQPPADLNITHLLSKGYRNGSTSLAAIKVTEPNHTLLRKRS